MRVMHVVHQFLPEHVGGTESYTRSLALAQARSGVRAMVVARRFGRGSSCVIEEQEGVTVARVVDGPFSPFRRFLQTLRAPRLEAWLARIAVDFQPDIVHLQHGMGLPIPALARLARRWPMVVTLHDYWWVCANAQLYTSYDERVCRGPRAWVNCGRCGLARVRGRRLEALAPAAAPFFGLRAGLLARLARDVGAWVAPTQFVRSLHLAHGWNAARVSVIRHGIELPPQALPLGAAHAAHRDESTREDPKLRIGYLGGLSRQKGVHVLVEAVRELGGEVELAIAGDESVFPDYCRRLRQRASPENTRFLGLLDQPGVWRTLAASDALVVPSLWHETSSLIAQQAHAVGLPVLMSDLGALPERIEHGGGLTVPPGDVAALRQAILRLAREPGLRSELRAGIRPVRTIDDHERELRELYLQLPRPRGS